LWPIGGPRLAQCWPVSFASLRTLTVGTLAHSVEAAGRLRRGRRSPFRSQVGSKGICPPQSKLPPRPRKVRHVRREFALAVVSFMSGPIVVDPSLRALGPRRTFAPRTRLRGLEDSAPPCKRKVVRAIRTAGTKKCAVSQIACADLDSRGSAPGTALGTQNLKCFGCSASPATQSASRPSSICALQCFRSPLE